MMKSRNLRIAWSVTCGVACVLLIALWVRSYAIRDGVWWPETVIGAEVNSLSGHFVLMIVNREQFGGGLPPFRTFHDKINPAQTLWFNKDVLGFLLHRQVHLTRIDIPFWFLTLIGIGIATTPWFLKNWRFSLRTLLTIMGLTAVILGMAVYAAQKVAPK